MSHTPARKHAIHVIELSEHLNGVTQSYISQLEAGTKEPSVHVALQVGDVFSVTLDYLLRDMIPVLPVSEEKPGVGG